MSDENWAGKGFNRKNEESKDSKTDQPKQDESKGKDKK